MNAKIFPPLGRRILALLSVIGSTLIVMRADPPTTLYYPANSSFTAANYGYSRNFQDTFTTLSVSSPGYTPPPDTTTWPYTWKYRSKGRIDSYDESTNLTLGTDSGGSYLDIAGTAAPSGGDNGYQFSGGGIISWQQYGYGYYEAVIQLPTNAGWHHSFWSFQYASNAATQIAGQSPSANEIDGFEINSNGGSTALSGTYNTYAYPSVAGVAGRLGKVTYGLEKLPPNPTTQPVEARGAVTITTTSTMTNPNPNVTPYDIPSDGAYHVYGWEWKPDQVIWYLDGHLMAQTRYAGPALLTNIWLTSLADNIGYGIEAGSHLHIRSVSYWQKEYGGLGPLSSGTIVPSTSTPCTFTGSWAASQMAPNEVGVLHAGDVQTSFVGGSTCTWPFPSSLSAGGYEVYVYNPSLLHPNILSPDNPIDDNPTDGVIDERHLVTYQVTPDGTAAVPPSQTIDQVYGGQQWVAIGAYAFTPGANEGVTLTAPPTPLIPTRAGPVAFRALDLAYDNFTGGLSSWTSFSGTWGIASGLLAQGSSSESVLLNPSATGTNYLARVGVIPGTATSVGVIGRYQDASNYYLLRIDTGAQKLGILKKAADSFTTLEEVAIPPDLAYSTTAANNLILWMDGDATSGVRLRGYFNGRELVQFVDLSSPFISGSAGLRTYGGTAQFQQFGAGH